MTDMPERRRASTNGRESHSLFRALRIDYIAVLLLAILLPGCFTPPCDPNPRALNFLMYHQYSSHNTPRGIADRRLRLKNDLEESIRSDGIESTITYLESVVGLRCDRSANGMKGYHCHGTHYARHYFMWGECKDGGRLIADIRIVEISQGSTRPAKYEVSGGVVSEDR
ncbi:MAG: hypothetical protein IPK81_21665 [Rhodospirillales bacterium]|nr:MAG: hypothetical protein IPK81_21665 [Rhodospirillales bacterium]